MLVLLQEAVRLRTSYADAYTGMGVSLKELKRKEEAEQCSCWTSSSHCLDSPVYILHCLRLHYSHIPLFRLFCSHTPLFRLHELHSTVDTVMKVPRLWRNPNPKLTPLMPCRSLHQL